MRNKHWKQQKEKRMREKTVEQKLVAAVRHMGGIAPKFVECKAPGKQLRSLQVHRKRQLEGLGFLVYCLDRPEAIGGILDEILCS